MECWGIFLSKIEARMLLIMAILSALMGYTIGYLPVILVAIVIGLIGERLGAWDRGITCLFVISVSFLGVLGIVFVFAGLGLILPVSRIEEKIRKENAKYTYPVTTLTAIIYAPWYFLQIPYID